jgi:hypothetical protein
MLLQNTLAPFNAASRIAATAIHMLISRLVTNARFDSNMDSRNPATASQTGDFAHF